MKTRKLLRRLIWGSNILLSLALILAWLFAPLVVQAQNNLLNNPNFEQAHGDGVTLTAPPGWSIWASTTDGLVGRQLRRGQEVVSSVGVLEGNGSFDAYKGWSVFSVSLYQTVSGIQPGATLRLSAFGRIWSCDSNAEEPIDPCIGEGGQVAGSIDTGASFRVGIDPGGGNDPNSPNIVWSNPIAPYSGFQQAAVEAAATAGSVTVVLNASMQTPARHQHVFWDQASLTVVGEGSGTAAQPQAASAPPAVAPEVVPQGPREDGSVVHVVRSGDTLAAIAVAYDIPIPELLELNDMTMEQARFIVPGQELLIRPATGDASEAPSSPADEEEGESASADEEAGEGAEDGEAAPAAASESEEPAIQPIEAYPTAPVAEAAVPMLRFEEGDSVGRVCAVLFDDVNANRLREAGEGLLAGGELVLSQDGAAVESYVTDGESEPHCFDDLAPGQYMVSLSLPAMYGNTTPDSYMVSVRAGQRVEAVFGAKEGYTPPQPPPSQAGGLFSEEPGLETDTRTDLFDSLLQYSGLIVLGLAGVVLVGGMLLILALRR